MILLPEKIATAPFTFCPLIIELEAPLPESLIDLLIDTLSLKVPGPTQIVSPEAAESTADCIVLNCEGTVISQSCPTGGV